MLRAKSLPHRRPGRLGVVVLAAVLGLLAGPAAAIAQVATAPPVEAELVSLGADVIIDADVFSGRFSRTDVSAAGISTARDGRAELSPNDARRPLRRRISLEEPWAVLRIEGMAEMGSGSRAGLMCGSDAAPRASTVGLVSSGAAFIGQLDANGWTESARAEHGQRLGPTTKLAFECALDADGRERAALWVDGKLALEATLAASNGPYGWAALSAETVQPPEPLTFEAVSISGANEYQPRSDGGPMRLAYRESYDDGSELEAFDDGVRSISYDDGVARVEISEPGRSFWSWQTLDEATPSMRVSASLSLDGDGVAGLMCADTEADPEFLVGVVSVTGSAAIGRLSGGDLEVLESVRLPEGADVSGDGLTRVTLDCLARGDTDRVTLWLDDREVANVLLAEGLGPYIRSGLYVEATSVPMSASYDDLEASIGG